MVNGGCGEPSIKTNICMCNITPEIFFRQWVSVCREKQTELLQLWEESPNYTAQMFCPEKGIISLIARTFGLRWYSSYYALDAVLFNDTDLVKCRPVGQTWIQNIRVAFEHENFFTSGLFQETSHLLITRADLRVLVTYPEDHAVQPELGRLSQLIADAKLENPSFLLILGERSENRLSIIWNGYTWSDRCLSLSFQSTGTLPDKSH